MENTRFFTVIAKMYDDDTAKQLGTKIGTFPVMLTEEQISLLDWLYERDLLNGTYETANQVCYEEP